MPISTYRRNLRAAVRGLWSGAISGDQFSEVLRADIDRNLTAAWDEGARLCGVSVEEYTDAEHLTLAEAILKEQGFVGGLRSAVEQNSKANKGKLSPLFQRAELWMGRYNELKDQAKAMACKDQKLEWVMDPAKENCDSCMRLNGQVRRASFWEARGLRPKSDQLQCMQSSGGVPVCGCEFIITDKPASKGPLPKI